MKKIIIILLMLALCLGAFTGCGSAKESKKSISALHVENGKLCNDSGEVVQLKGVSTHAITRVEMLINQDLLKEMHTQWGINVIRLAMYTLSNDSYNKSDYYREKNTELMKKGIDMAIAEGMYVICDWHVLQDGNPLEYKEEAKEFFDMISSDYANCPNLIYEICNEPNGCQWSDIKTYAEEVIPVIRANSPNAVIICGTPEWSQRVDQAMADPLQFENVMYTLHFYSATHKDELRNRMVECSKAGLPIFVTEYGVTASNGGHPRDLDEADKWMEAMDTEQISSCIWCLAKNGEACCLINSNVAKTSGFQTGDLTETGTWFLDMLKK